MPDDDMLEIRSVIARHWGFRELRPLQEQAIRADLERRDSLVVMPTGGGKSLCYQAPAAWRGNETSVVVSPLISLMKDQVDALTSAGVPALRVDSTLSEDEKRRAANELRTGRIRLLFVSPERLVIPKFQTFLRELGVRTFAIDEAHCISHWGHDFRPEYRQLATLRDLFPAAAFHAFTATATESVRRDIVEQLHLRNPADLVGNFDRPNLVYRALPRRGELEQVLDVLARHKNQAGIIYCISRKKVDALTQKLCELGYNALRYRAAHPDEPADVNARERKATHDAFRAGTCDLVVATVAFGMGIDRSDIRFVLHVGMPKSVEHYQQEAGRAGRDGLPAECLMLYTGNDVRMWKEIAGTALAERRISQELCEHSCRQAEEMNSYAKSGRCRHRALVEHFGQRFENDNCGACDVCLSEIEFEPEGTVIAQKILSCVARVGERFGIGHVADVLRGIESERVARLSHNQLSTFALLQEYPERQVKDWISQLVSEGLLSQTTDEYPVLKLNDESWQVMRKVRAVRLVRAGSRGSRRAGAEAPAPDGVDERVFAALRAWRREIAARNGIPPYTVFHDSTLRDIGQAMPTTLDKLHEISGIGEAKLQNYGQAILDLVGQLARDHDLPCDNRLENKRIQSEPSKITAGAAGAFPHFRAGKSIAEVARLIDKTEGTTAGYLALYIESERPAAIDMWVDRATQERIIAAARLHGATRLKPVYLECQQEVAYDTIRIVLSFLNTRAE